VTLLLGSHNVFELNVGLATITRLHIRKGESLDYLISEDIINFLSENAKCQACNTFFDISYLEKPCCNQSGTYLITHDQYEMELAPLLQKAKKKLKDRNSYKKRQYREKQTVGHHSEKEIEALYKLQKGECYYCGNKLGKLGIKKAFDKDHIKPLAMGGTNWLSNIALSCQPCNNKKHSKSEKEFWQVLEKDFGKKFVKSRKAAIKSYSEEKRKLSN